MTVRRGLIGRRAAIVLATLSTGARAEGGGAPIFAAGATMHAVTAMQVARRAAGQPVPGALFDTAGAVRDRILAGERPAVALLTAEGMEALAARGIVARDGVAELGRTGVGLAAPLGRPVPDIATPEALRAALLGAESVAMADPARGATAGRHFVGLLDRLGIAAAMRPRLRLVPFGAEGVEMAAHGEVALAVSQATEIVGREGVQLVGLLPEALNLWTAYRIAVVADGAEARELFALLTGDAARGAFARSGFRP